MKSFNRMAKGNEALLFRVWQNIIGNAVKFTNSGGRISISLKRDRSFVWFPIPALAFRTRTDSIFSHRFIQGASPTAREETDWDCHSKKSWINWEEPSDK